MCHETNTDHLSRWKNTFSITIDELGLTFPRHLTHDDFSNITKYNYHCLKRDILSATNAILQN